MKTKLLLLLALCTITCVAQEVKDSLDNTAIPFVEIYSEQGDLLGRTDYAGKIDNALLQRIADSKTSKISFVHPFFYSKELSTKDFNINSTVELSPISFSLQEIEVQPNRNYKNLLLTAYFRSLQTDKKNENLHYFMDGFVKFYINQKTGKIKTVFICNQSFENKNIKHLKESKYVFVGIKSAGVPDLLTIPFYENITKNYSLTEINADSLLIYGKKRKDVIGHVLSMENKVEINLNIYSETNPKIRSLFGIKDILNNQTVFATFANTTTKDYSLNNLVYFKESKSIEVYKKESSQKADVVYEIFVVDREYTNEEFKGDFAYYNFVPSGNAENCNKKVENVYYQPLPNNLVEYIKNHLTEYK